MQQTESILELWPLPPVRKIKRVHHKENRTVYQIITHHRIFCLKVYESCIAPMMELKKVLQSLQSSSFPGFPPLVPTQTGDIIARNRCQSALLMPWYRQGKMPRIPTAYRSLGLLISALHKESVPDHDVHPDSPAERDQLRRQANHLPDPAWYLNLLESIPDFNNLPRRFIHGDVGPHNTLLDSDNNLILIDWDNAGCGARIWDLALPLIWMFIGRDCDLRGDNARAFYSGYQQTETLTHQEQELIFPAALFFALKYVFFRGPEINIRRIQTALTHRSELESWVRA